MGIKNQSGFGLHIIAPLLAAIFVVCSIGWYVVHKNQSSSKSYRSSPQNAPPPITSPSTSKINPPEADTYPGWGKAELTAEELSFRYPLDWKAKTSGGALASSPISAESMEITSPVDSGHYFGVSLMAGPDNTQINLNMLGEAKGTTISKLDVKGSPQQLYLDAQTAGVNGNVTCLGLATTPGGDKASFGIIDKNMKGVHNIVMYACLLPVTPTGDDQGYEYSMNKYTSNKYYQTVIEIFKSLSYE